jgi:ABC-type transport system involved in multi-copper enzyme maturation permease subunit
MTTVTEHPAPQVAAEAKATGPGPTFLRLVRGELLKVRTTNVWWIFAICAFAATALALAFNALTAHFEIHDALNPPDFASQYPPGQHPSAAELDQQMAQWRASHVLSTILVRHAASIFTSGQFFGLLILMLFGALLVTGEYHNQTATTTFLGEPRRSRVIGAKVATAIVVAAVVWVVTTLIDLVTGAIFFGAEGQTNSIGVWDVQRSILMNLPAYALWALLGMGLGALIRNQVASTLVGAGLYLIGGQIAQLVFVLVYHYVLTKAWVLQSMVGLPSVASSVMISPERVSLSGLGDGAIFLPQWWVGGLVLLAYGIVATGIGTLLIRRRDIS